MQTVGKCRLCQNVKPLLNKSHIIPEFMYEPLFDADHKVEVFSPVDRLNGKGIIQRPSTGEYEGGILCGECDNETIGQYETYAHHLLYGGKSQDVSKTICQTFAADGDNRYTICSNVDYKKFKMFLLSVLWRASISSRSFFSEVNLGPYEERIRAMLLNGDPKEETVFPIMLMTWLNDKSFSSEMIGPPRMSRSQNGIRYIFTISGFIYVYFISPGSISKSLAPYALSSNNEFYLLHMPKDMNAEVFLRLFGIT